jgi:2-methylcitrate synthase
VLALQLLSHVIAVLHRYHYAFHSGRRIKTQTAPGDTIAANFVKLLRYGEEENSAQAPHELLVRCINTSLILYAEHGFAASSFAARVTASTNSDVFSCCSAAMATLRGNLHGGANEAAMKLVYQFKPNEDVEAKLAQMLKEKKLIMG